MTTATLCTLRGSVVLTVPKKLLDLLHLPAGAQVEMRVENGALIVQPVPKPQYTLAELLAQCTPADFTRTVEDGAWLNATPVGNEDW